MLNKGLAAATLVFSFGGSAAANAQDAALVADGEKMFRRCAACHQVGDGAQNRVGPELADVIGRQAGTAADFKYSDAMVAAGEGGLVWDETTISEFIENPKQHVEGTSMAFAGLKKEDDRLSVVAYIAANQAAN